jgi:C-22 sterol desaturase
MIGKASMFLDWVHHPTPRSEEIKVFATIFPMVSGLSVDFLYILTLDRMTAR